MLAPQNAPSPIIPYHPLLHHLQYAYNTILSSIQEFPTFHILSYIQLGHTDEKNPSPRRLINVDPPSQPGRAYQSPLKPRRALTQGLERSCSRHKVADLRHPPPLFPGIASTLRSRSTRSYHHDEDSSLYYCVPASPRLLPRSSLDPPELPHLCKAILIRSIPSLRFLRSGFHRYIRARSADRRPAGWSKQCRSTSDNTQSIETTSGPIRGGTGEGEEGAKCCCVQSLPADTGASTAG